MGRVLEIAIKPSRRDGEGQPHRSFREAAEARDIPVERQGLGLQRVAVDDRGSRLAGRWTLDLGSNFQTAKVNEAEASFLGRTSIAGAKTTFRPPPTAAHGGAARVTVGKSPPLKGHCNWHTAPGPSD